MLLHTLLRTLLCMVALLFSVSLPAQALQLVASVRPIALLASELTQSLPFHIATLLPEGATPHDYGVKPSDLKALQQAQMVVWLGPKSEPYLSKVMSKVTSNVTAKAERPLAWEQLEQLHTLPLRKALQRDADHGHQNHEHDHHDDHRHSTGFDPHFWFSIENALALTDALQQQLVQLYPQGEATLALNQANLKQRLQQQLAQAKSLIKTKPQPFMLAHDAYQYLEQDLGVYSEATVVLDPEVKPGAKHIMALMQLVGQRDIACVVTDPMVSTALLKKLDGKQRLTQIAIDPLAWDFQGTHFSAWIFEVYEKMRACAAGY